MLTLPLHLVQGNKYKGISQPCQQILDYSRSDKHSSLLRYGIYYDCKMFCKTVRTNVFEEGIVNVHVEAHMGKSNRTFINSWLPGYFTSVIYSI